MKRAFSLALAISAQVLAGCSGCSQRSTDPADGQAGDAASDVAAGGTAGDGAVDVLGDPILDSVKDVTKLEASLEAGVEEGTWVKSPYSDFIGCPVEQPADLATVTPATWLPCPGGLSGCQLLDTAYLPGYGGMIVSFVAPVGMGPLPMFAVQRRLGGKLNSPTIFRAGSGPALASWRYETGSCGMMLLELNKEEAALVLNLTDDRITQSDVTERIALGTPEALMSETSESYDLPFGMFNYNGARTISTSKSLMATVLMPSGRMVVASRPNGKVVEVPVPGGAGSAEFGTPLVVGPDVVVDITGVGGERIVVRHPNEVVENLRYDPARYIGLLSGDDAWMVWQEGYNGTVSTGFANVELWAAKPNGNPATFAPGKVADLPLAATDSHMSSDNACGEGWYLFQVGVTQIRAMRISDGKYADFAAPDGYAFIKPLNVAGGEAWMLLRKSTGSPQPVTIERLAVTSLSLQ